MTMHGKTASTKRHGRVLLMASAAAVVALGATAVSAREVHLDQRPWQVASTGTETRPETAKLIEQAKQALSQNHPDVAAIFLRNALAAEPENADVRVQLGTALFRSGDLVAAERELRTAREKGAPDASVLPILFGVMIARSEDEQLLAQFPPPSESDTSAVASDTLRARATAMARRGNLREAAASLDRAISFNSSVANLVARAQLAEGMGQKGLALQSVDEALSKSPKEAAALILKIDLLLQDKQQDKALETANQLVNDYPNNGQALINRARVYLQMKDNTKALADLDAGLKLAPSMPLGLLYKALILDQANDTKQAWSLVQDLPPAFVNSRPDIGTSVGQIAIKAGHLEIGTSILAAVVANYPKDVNARVSLATRYIELKDTTRALETLQPMSDSSDPRIILLLAQAYQMQQQYSTAAEYAQKASDEGVGGDALKRQIALINMQGGKIDAAMNELEKLNTASPGDPLVAGPLIGALINKNELAKAREVAEKLVSAAPKQPYGPYFQGQISLRQNDLDGAVSAFSRAVELDPKYIPALYERAAAYGARGDLKLAEGDLRSILDVDPKNLMAEINIAQLAIRSGQKDTAEATLKKAVAAHPTVPLPTLVLASFEVQQGQFDDATAAVKDFLGKSPGNPEALTMQGYILLISGKADQAVNTFNEIARADPKSPQIQLLLATALSKAGQPQDAARAYQRALELSPSMHAAHLGLIQLALANKDEGAALAAAQNYAEKQPGPVSAQTLASTYMSLKKVKDAEDVLLRTQEKYPNSSTLVSLTRLLRNRGEVKRADTMLTEWIDKHPEDINVRLDYATTQLQTDPAAAEVQYRAVLQAQPYNLGALNNLAWLLQKKNPEEALPYAERALKIAPESPAVLDTLAWTKWLVNDKSGALPLLERAHAADANNGDVAYHLVLALDANGRHDDAKKLLTELLASNRQFPERNQAELLSTKWQ
jgi:putative PEP-CTERM system TPR-repeat lipoprotein